MSAYIRHVHAHIHAKMVPFTWIWGLEKVPGAFCPTVTLCSLCTISQYIVLSLSCCLSVCVVCSLCQLTPQPGIRDVILGAFLKMQLDVSPVFALLLRLRLRFCPHLRVCVCRCLSTPTASFSRKLNPGNPSLSAFYPFLNQHWLHLRYEVSLSNEAENYQGTFCPALQRQTGHTHTQITPVCVCVCLCACMHVCVCDVPQQQ